VSCGLLRGSSATQRLFSLVLRTQPLRLLLTKCLNLGNRSGRVILKALKLLCYQAEVQFRAVALKVTACSTELAANRLGAVNDLKISPAVGTAQYMHTHGCTCLRSQASDLTIIVFDAALVV
jgi:hypothetical protein